MNESKLISLLSTFSKKEFAAYFKYINSPFFNSDKVLIKFSGILKKSFPMLENIGSKTEIFSRLYPGKKYNDSMMRNVLTKMLKLAEEYLINDHFNKFPEQQAIMRMRIYSDRKQHTLYRRAKEQADLVIKKIPFHDSYFYYINMQFEDEKRRYNAREKSKVIIFDDNIQKVSDNVIFYSMAELLRLYAVMINLNKYSIDNDLKLRFLDPLLKFYEENKGFFAEVQYVHLYYNSIKLFLTEAPEYFDEVHKLTVLNYNTLPDIDKKNAYVVLVNYCSEMINKGILEYLRKKFELYKEIIDRKAHYEGLDYLSHIFYNRVIFTAVNLGELDWARTFIEDYRDELEPEQKENAYRLSLAEYYLKSENFDNALENLSQVKRTDFLYKQEIYFVLLKICFMTDAHEQFYSELDNFRNFLMSNKLVTARRKELGLSFCRFIKKLFYAKQELLLGNKIDLQALEFEIFENGYLTDKFWLLDKIRVLKDTM